MHECPECGKPMYHQAAEPDVGIVGCWVCGGCDYGEPDDDDYSDD